MPPTPVATVDVKDETTPVLLVMRGEFDLHALRGVRDPITRLLADPPADLVVDMSEVAFIDSSGIAMLVNLYSHVAGQPDGRMRVQGVSPSARRLLEICGLLETFGVDSSWHDGQDPPSHDGQDPPG